MAALASMPFSHMQSHGHLHCYFAMGHNNAQLPCIGPLWHLMQRIRLSVLDGFAKAPRPAAVYTVCWNF